MKRIMFSLLCCLMVTASFVSACVEFGDINSDFKVDIFDLAKVGLCYGQPPVANCSTVDINKDERIDIFDLATVGKNYNINLKRTAKLSSTEITQYLYQYNYSQADINLDYYICGDTFKGEVSGTNLKPNFTYQMKLEGKPECIYPNGNNDSNKNIGYIGRWWDYNVCTNTCNIATDAYVESHPDHCILGYVLFDFLTADSNGSAYKEFSLDSSYHVLWCSNPETGTNNLHLQNGYCKLENLWPEPQRGAVSMSSGNYTLKFLLTEESFHSTSSGQWPTVLTGDAEFRVG